MTRLDDTPPGLPTDVTARALLLARARAIARAIAERVRRVAPDAVPEPGAPQEEDSVTARRDGTDPDITLPNAV